MILHATSTALHNRHAYIKPYSTTGKFAHVMEVQQLNRYPMLLIQEKTGMIWNPIGKALQNRYTCPKPSKETGMM